MALSSLCSVMAGLRPGHPRLACWCDHKDVDARHKAGHDEPKKAPAKPGPSIHWMPPIKSARIEFDDQMRLHLDREGHVRQSGDAGELRRHLGVIDFEEIGHVALGKLNGFQNGGELF